MSCLMLVFGASCSTLSKMTAFPSIRTENSHYVLLLVDSIKYKGELPESEKCRGPTTICMDPPPFWFTATVLESIYGNVQAREISIAATSHYGSREIEEWQGPALVALITSGRDFVMLRYALQEMVPGKDGKRFLFVGDSTPPWWLPCSASSLVKHIRPDDVLHPNKYMLHQPGLLADLLDGYEEVDGGYFPKHAIEYSALSSLLERNSRNGPVTYCDK